MVRIGLTRGEGGERWSLPGTAVADLVWVHSTREEGVEHLRARAGPDEIDIVLFLCVPKANSAEETAARICSRVVECVPALRGWSLQEAP
jgi:hypothetical protein